MSSAALRPRADERWLAGTSPVERLSATTAVFVLVSIAIHVAMVATTLIGTRTPPPPPQEVTVEIVREVPRETPAAKPQASKTAKAEPAKLEPAKPEPAKPALAKAEPSKVDPPKVDPPKAAPPPKTEAVKPDPPPAKVQQPSQPPKPAPARDAAAEAQKAATIKAMEGEIASLKAEQAALEAENAKAARAAAAAVAASEARSVALRDTGLGPLPDTFQAVALPAAADGAGEAVDYREIVFSALAKAKEIGGQMGLPGSAGVHFEIDAAGKLISVELVHPSGVAVLDAQALAIVRKAAPFPPPPQGAQRSFDADVNFVTASGR